MKISILMNCYNADKTLEEAVDSVLAQTCTDWELVVVENHSTDRSAEIIAAYAGRDSRIRICPTPVHMTLGEAREFGIALCDGDYVCFLDTDDRWGAGKLEIQLAYMNKLPEAGVLYGSCCYIDETGSRIGTRTLPYRQGLLFNRNLRKYEVIFQTLMIRRETLQALGKPVFDPFFTYAPDYDFVLRLLAANTAICQPEILVFYRVGSGSLTARSLDRWGPEMEYALDKFSRKDPAVARSREFRKARATAAYCYALHYFNEGQRVAAREQLWENVFVDLRCSAAYLLSYSRDSFMRIQQVKKIFAYGRKLLVKLTMQTKD